MKIKFSGFSFRKTNIFTLKLLFLILFFSQSSLHAQIQFGSGNDSLNPDFAKSIKYRLNKPWKYHEGDDKRWAAFDLDDSDWLEVKKDTSSSMLIIKDTIFNGIGWFRMQIEIDSSLMNTPLAMKVNMVGAMEIYIDGKFVHSFGLVGNNKEKEKAQFIIRHTPFAFVFSKQKVHVIALRYSNFKAIDLQDKYDKPYVFLDLSINDINYSIVRHADFTNFLPLVFLSVIFLVLGLVHLLLFLYYKKNKQNFYYSIYSFGLFLIIFSIYNLYLTTNLELARIYSNTIFYAAPIIPISLLALLYTIFYTRMLKFFWILLVLSTTFLAMDIFDLNYKKFLGVIIFLASTVEIYRVVIKAIKKKKEGSMIFGFGFLYTPCLLIFIIIIELVTENSKMSDFSKFFEKNIIPAMFLGALLSISISMTIYLAREFARTNKKLKIQINEIQELSEKTLQQETEKKKILENQKLLLEKTVFERTAEVVKKKNELENTLENLKSTQDQLVQSEKMASLGQLTAGVAHEINNPINFVSANISPLKRDINEIMTLIEKYASLDKNNFHTKLDEILKFKNDIDLNYTIKEIKSLLGGIEEGSRRTTEIVKGLRNFSRVDDEDMKQINLNEGIESTLILLQNKLHNKKINVVKSLDDLPGCECYPGQLNQVFMNLLSNAIDAIGENGTINILTKKENSHIKISIRDDGHGMSPEVRQRIFDPFFTTKEVGKGTGLGLSISYGIIEKHKGKIDVISELGKGAEFIITLPILN